jgi:PPOX class probable FMN-dependent enzyme
MAQISTLEQLREHIPAPNPVTQMKVLDHLDEQALEFISRSPFLLLSTVGEGGAVEVSPKGDEVGFVKVEDERTILIPDRNGNNLAFGLLNVLANPEVGMIFLAPGTGETLRVGGTASIRDDADVCARLSSRGKPAKLYMQIDIKRAYFHCARSILRAGLWDTKTWPDPPMRVSFGKLFKKLMKAEESIVKVIDNDIAVAYKPENL